MSVHYTHAIICRVPMSLRTCAEIQPEEARKQHQALALLLRQIGLDVIEMPPDEASPLCCYVEDLAIVCNGVALIAKPKESSRIKEIQTLRAVLKKELEIPLIEIADEQACLDGGDVLFTGNLFLFFNILYYFYDKKCIDFFSGREFFVGLSQFTNEGGAQAVAAAFPEYPCTPIKVSESNRLKTLVTMAGPDVICVSSGKSSQEVLKRIEREATYSYQTLTVPEDTAANVLYVNGVLIHRSPEEIPQSSKLFAEKIDFPSKPVCIQELAKVSSGLTSCCLLVRKPRLIRNI
uniref:Dimethylargininase n=1 Tax=Trichogramma kaykai TaxID=54128 RepID=A0ABD2XKI4_9HYME